MYVHYCVLYSSRARGRPMNGDRIRVVGYLLCTRTFARGSDVGLGRSSEKNFRLAISLAMPAPRTLEI